MARAQDGRVIEGGYEITFIGFSGFRIDFTARLEGDRYDVDSRTYKVGILKALTLHYEGLNRGWGTFTAAGAHPIGGSLSLLIDGKPRTWLTQYDADGTLHETHVPPWNPSSHDSIPDDKMKGSLDPLTAAIAAGMAGDKACDQPAPSNDGKRRIDVILTKVDVVGAATADIAGAIGDVLVCDVYTKRIAGQFDEPQNEAETGGEKPMRLWLARFDDTPIRYPGRLEAHTAFGTIQGRVRFFHEHPLTGQDTSAPQK